MQASNFGGTFDKLFLWIFYEIFAEDASLLLLYHGAKKSKMTKNSNQGGPGNIQYLATGNEGKTNPIFWIRFFSNPMIEAKPEFESQHTRYTSIIGGDLSSSVLSDICSEAVFRTHDSGAHKRRRLQTSAIEN